MTRRTGLRIAGVLVVLLLAACTRGLTESEAQLARDVFGDDLDVTQVRIAKDFGLLPPPQSARISVDRRKVAEGATPCLREPTPPRTEAPPAFAIGNTLFLSDGIYLVDGGVFWPAGITWPQTFVFVHELTHVWQWQNREITGYSPLRALAEGLPGRDAYFYDPDVELRFENFGFEQQASIIEDYLCHLAFEPANPRVKELRSLIDPVLPMDRLDARIGAARR